MKKRWLVFAPTFSLIIVFIVASILFVAPAQLFAPVALTTGYVNGTNGDDTWDGSSPTHTGVDIGPKKTIAAGLVAVANRGTLHIAAGTYNENLTITNSTGQTLTINGAGKSSTIIDGGQNGSVFNISGSGSVILKNLTITNGNSTQGGGISLWYSALEIDNCIIKTNNSNFGAGIYNVGPNVGPLNIKNSIITDNHAGFAGGGILNSGTLIITGSSISNNTDVGGSLGSGAGIYSGVNSNTAINNWWGSSTGPFNLNLNPGGTGNAVTDNVNFIPFLTSDPFAPAPKKTKTVAASALNEKPLSDYDKTDSGFVTLLYNRILDRDPDAIGLANQTAALESGLTRMDLVNNFIFSEECQNKISGYSNEQFIKFLYQALFNREADTEGFNNWLEAMNSGMTKAEVVNAFTHSLEFEFLY